MTNTAWLPRFLRAVFTVFMVLNGIAAIALVVFIAIDPRLPIDSFGPINVHALGQPGTVVMRHFTLVAQLLNGGFSLRIDDASGFVEVVKHAALPLALMYVLFYAFLFDLLRRLFRNVGRSESFTHQNVGLVQIIGFSLLGFSLVSAAADSWFHYAVFSYIAQHATIAISGTAMHLPHPDTINFKSGGGFPFGSPYFFTGLLVLALSEVFRQGLVLKSENDLTV